MDLTKRLGFSQDLLNSVVQVLEGKNLPGNQERIDVAEPKGKITSADFEKLQAKKKYRVEGYDRNKKPYQSDILESELEAVSLYNKLRKSAPLVNLQIVEIEEKVAETTTVEAKEVNTTNATAEREHDCAKHVVHEQWGAGSTIPTMHAEPDAAGNIAWYDIMFEHGIERNVPTSSLEITLSESHKHGFVKRKVSEAADEVKTPKQKTESKSEVDKRLVLNPKTNKMSNEEVEHVAETYTKYKMSYHKGSWDDSHRVLNTTLDLSQSPDWQPGEDSDPHTPERIRKLVREHPKHKEVKAQGYTIRKYGDHDKSNTGKTETMEEVELIDEGRKMDETTAALTLKTHPLHKAATEKFRELTGGKGDPNSYFHRKNKYRDHAEAAVAHAKKATSAPAPKAGDDKAGGESEPAHREDDADTEANKHPINQLRGIMDRGSGNFMGKKINRGHAANLIAQHDALKKPAEKIDFVANIGKHLKKVIGE